MASSPRQSQQCRVETSLSDKVRDSGAIAFDTTNTSCFQRLRLAFFAIGVEECVSATPTIQSGGLTSTWRNKSIARGHTSEYAVRI